MLNNTNSALEKTCNPNESSVIVEEFFFFTIMDNIPKMFQK